VLGSGTMLLRSVYKQNKKKKMRRSYQVDAYWKSRGGEAGKGCKRGGKSGILSKVSDNVQCIAERKQGVVNVPPE